MPIFELFISMLECADAVGADGVVHNVNHYAHGLICWYGEHYVHATLAILVSVAFVIICIVVSITYYESKTSHNNHSARIHSRADVFLLISKIISILLFAFFNQDNLQWILVFAIFILSAFMYLNYYLYKPYYNQSVQNVAIYLK
jgi:glucose uptake protein GlcU